MRLARSCRLATLLRLNKRSFHHVCRRRDKMNRSDPRKLLVRPLDGGRLTDRIGAPTAAFGETHHGRRHIVHILQAAPAIGGLVASTIVTTTGRGALVLPSSCEARVAGLAHVAEALDDDGVAQGGLYHLPSARQRGNKKLRRASWRCGEQALTATCLEHRSRGGICDR